MATVLDREVPKLELNYNYVNASVMLKRGNSYARGNFIRRGKDTDVNTVGRTNNNPIFDTMEYSVDFDDGYVSELTENMISWSMYAACDDSEN